MSVRFHSRWRPILLGLSFLWWLTIVGGTPAGALAVVAPPTNPGAAPGTARILQEQPTGKNDQAQEDEASNIWTRITGITLWLWELGTDGTHATLLPRAMIAAFALLVAFLTVVQIWQIPPESTSLTKGSRQPSNEVSSTPDGVKTSTSSSSAAGLLFDSNFSRTALSGLGGLAVVSLVKSNEKEFVNAQAYYIVLFVLFFLAGLLFSAVIRGLGEAIRSRIVLRTPAVQWPPLPFGPKAAGQTVGEPGRIYRFLRWARYWMRRGWRWLASYRATILVFIDTTFNVLMGKNQLQTAIFSETITDHHESLIGAAERVRESVHRAVILALSEKNALPGELPHQERIRVAVSLLSSDGASVYYIAWERGGVSERFDQHSIAWISASTGQARWYRSDPHCIPEGQHRLDPIYQGSDAVLFDNTRGEIPGPPAELLLRQYYQRRGVEDYEGFIVLPMPWVSRGRTDELRRGAIHISFKEARLMSALWENLEAWDEGKNAVVPNYTEWQGLLEAPERPERLPSEEDAESRGELLVRGRMSDAEILELGLSRLIEQRERPAAEGLPQTRSRRITIKDQELCSVLYQALEVLGTALSHFDDDVYEVYVRARTHV